MPLRARGVHFLVSVEEALVPRSREGAAVAPDTGVPCGQTGLTVRTPNPQYLEYSIT